MPSTGASGLCPTTSGPRAGAARDWHRTRGPRRPHLERAASVPAPCARVAPLRRARLPRRRTRRRRGRAVGDGARGGGGGATDAGVRTPPSESPLARAAGSVERGTRAAVVVLTRLGCLRRLPVV